MSKIRTLFVCSTCGAGSSQWFGKCPSCNNYGTLEEQIAPNNTNSLLGSRDNHLVRKSHGIASPRNSVRFSEISALGQTRFTSGYAEFDRVLGGGVVPVGTMARTAVHNVKEAAKVKQALKPGAGVKLKDIGKE